MSTITVNVFEADAQGATVVDTVTVNPEEGTTAAYVPGASTIPAGFTCSTASPSDVICSAAADLARGSYTFQLAYTLTNATGLPATISDTAVVAALNTDTSLTTAQVTVTP